MLRFAQMPVPQIFLSQGVCVHQMKHSTCRCSYVCLGPWSTVLTIVEMRCCFVGKRTPRMWVEALFFLSCDNPFSYVHKRVFHLPFLGNWHQLFRYSRYGLLFEPRAVFVALKTVSYSSIAELQSCCLSHFFFFFLRGCVDFEIRFSLHCHSSTCIQTSLAY